MRPLDSFHRKSAVKKSNVFNYTSYNQSFNDVKYTYLSAILNVLDPLGSVTAGITGAATGVGCV